MKAFISIIFIFCYSISGYTQQFEYHDISEPSPADTLFRISASSEYEIGDPCGYINQKGDTIHSIGTFNACFSETIITFGIVADPTKPDLGLIGIDQKGNMLFQAYIYDNGPDWLEEGLFRIIRNGKIGFADSTGRIIIKPQFECASQFSNGKAKVAYTCKLSGDVNEEHRSMESDSWFFIDTQGNRINQ